MRMLDLDRSQSVSIFQLYISTAEANELKKGLEMLLKDPEANEHFHVCSEDSPREISVSILTDRKFRNSKRYTELERRILSEK